MLTLIIVLAALLVSLVGFILILYNRLVRLRNKTDNAWHQIDVQLKRRYNLIPVLTETVRGYAAHERNALDSVAAVRSRVMRVSAVGERGPAEDDLTTALFGLTALAEKYPDLKANKDFLELQKELSSTENKIAGARKYYNGAVMYYDNARQGFPGNIVARMFPRRFDDREYFEIQVPEEGPSTAG